jgi:hypothetical protein
VLLVVARPHGKHDVGYRTISQPLVEAVQNANLPVKIDILRPGTYRALVEHLKNTTARRDKGYYHLIHFDFDCAVLDYDTLGHEAGRFVYQSRYEPPETQYGFVGRDLEVLKIAYCHIICY